MTEFRVHVVVTVPATEEVDAINEVSAVFDEAGRHLDWDITEVWDYDEWEDEEDEEEFVMDEW